MDTTTNIANPIFKGTDEKGNNKENTLPTNTQTVDFETYNYKDNVIIDEKLKNLTYYKGSDYDKLTPVKQNSETVKATLATLYILTKLSKFNTNFAKYIEEIQNLKQQQNYKDLHAKINSYYYEISDTYNKNKISKPFTLFGSSRRTNKKRNTRNRRRIYRPSKVRRYKRRHTKTSKL